MEEGKDDGERIVRHWLINNNGEGKDDGERSLDNDS